MEKHIRNSFHSSLDFERFMKLFEFKKVFWHFAAPFDKVSDVGEFYNAAEQVTEGGFRKLNFFAFKRPENISREKYKNLRSTMIPWHLKRKQRIT